MSTKLWQPYDEQGRPLPEGANQHEVAVLGKLHGAAHVWLWRKNGGVVELLLQKRSLQKITWPGLFDKSAGGHCLFGEAPLQTAVRKLHEELGVSLAPVSLDFIGVNRYYQRVSSSMTETDDTDLIENELQWMFLAPAPSEPFTPSPREVAVTVWTPLHDLQADLADPQKRMKYVPIPESYLCLLRGAINRQSSLHTI